MKYSLALHIIGFVMWIGGMLILSRVMKSLHAAEGSINAFAGTAKRIYFGWIVPGLVVSTVTGLYQISLMGLPGWMHGKLTLLVVLAVLTGLLFTEVKKINLAQPMSPGKLSMIHGLSGFCLIAIVFITMLSR